MKSIMNKNHKHTGEWYRAGISRKGKATKYMARICKTCGQKETKQGWDKK